MKRKFVNLLFFFEIRINRRAELFRGWFVKLRGAQVGVRFGVGTGTRFIRPQMFSAGEKVTIGDYSLLDCVSIRGVKIGNNTSIDRNLWLSCGGLRAAHTGFFEIGDNSYIGCNAVLGAGGGGITIGNGVLIGQAVTMHSESHIYNDPSKLIREQGISYHGITIEDDVWIGSNSTILDGVTIGTGSVIGAGSIVTKSLPPYSIAVGVPAKVIRKREDENADRDLS